METASVTVIIPVYNTAPWLAECLDSVLSQEYPDIEIICIDDGSTDSGPAILKSYAQKDPRIILRTQDNHGPGFTRNRAMEAAKGKYILFLDSDDKLEDGFISRLAERAEQDALDMLCYDLAPFYESETVAQAHPEMGRHHNSDYPGVYDGRDLFTRMRRNNDYFSAGCLALYRREWLEEKQIRFPEGIFHEDELFMFCCFLHAERAGFIPVRSYLRRLRNGSTMTKARSLIHVQGFYRTANLLMEIGWQNSERLGNYPEFLKYMLEARSKPSYILKSNEAQIRAEAVSAYDRMMLDDIDGYGSKAELDAVYNSASWKVGNSLIRPLHFLKTLLHKR